MPTDIRIESRQEKHTRGGLEITRVFRVTPYTDAPAVVATLLGEIKTQGGGYVRTMPHRDPRYPHCRCQEATVDHVEVLNVPGIATTTAAMNAAEYAESARVTAVYRPLETEVSDSQDELELASEAFDFKYTVQQAPALWWTWRNGGDSVPLPQEGQQFAKTYPMIDYTLTRNFCLTIPALSMGRLANRVNRYDFSFGRMVGIRSKVQRQWAAETVRYEGSNVQRRITNKGVPFYVIAHRFAIFPHWDEIGDWAGESAVIPSEGGERNVPAGGATTINFVGWNRLFRWKYGWWEKPVLQAPANVAAPKNSTIYMLDTDITQTIKGQSVAGFRLLFNRYAA